jgi:hypothetical protein
MAPNGPCHDGVWLYHAPGSRRRVARKGGSHRMSSEFPSAPTPGGPPAAPTAPATGERPRLRRRAEPDHPRTSWTRSSSASSTFVVGVILAGLGLTAVNVNSDLSVTVNYVAAFVQGILASVDQCRLLHLHVDPDRGRRRHAPPGMQIGNAGDGADDHDRAGDPPVHRTVGSPRSSRRSCSPSRSSGS